MHIMQKEKCIPVGLYRLLCLKARGPWNSSVARVLGARNVCCLLHSVTSYEREKLTDGFTLRNVACWVYIRACNHEYRETPAGLEQIKTQYWPFAPLIIYLNRCDDDKCQCDGVLCYHKPCSCESCSVHLQHRVNWALLYNWVHFALIRPWSKINHQAK